MVDWCRRRVEVHHEPERQNPHTHAPAKELAALTGENVTAAVTLAIEERLQRIRRRGEKRLSERLIDIGRDAAGHFREPFRSMDHGDFLYDERGLAKRPSTAWAVIDPAR